MRSVTQQSATRGARQQVIRTMSNIYLVGFMGCGKSTIGRRLAAAGGYNFVDLDQRVCDLAGMTIPEIFASQGEEAFREWERKALEEVAQMERVVE